MPETVSLTEEAQLLLIKIQNLSTFPAANATIVEESLALMLKKLEREK